MAKALNVSPTSVLGGYLLLGSYVLSPASVQVPDTNWEEPILLWLTISMPTGSGKSTLFRHLFDLLKDIRGLAGVTDADPSWNMDDATFEKMGALMQENSSRLIGIYDELSGFLSQINLYRGRSLSDSHELSLFLQLFNGHSWRRDTGMSIVLHKGHSGDYVDLFIVSGEANFIMSSTRLTIGGFTQAGTARNLIDMPANSEKGLSHRFLWLFPKPLFGKFSSLEKIDEEFIADLSKLNNFHTLQSTPSYLHTCFFRSAKLLSQQWRKSKPRTELETRKFSIPKSSNSGGVQDSGENDSSSSSAEESGSGSDKTSAAITATPIETFEHYYNKTQQDLETLSGTDEFLAGINVV